MRNETNSHRAKRREQNRVTLAMVIIAIIGAVVLAQSEPTQPEPASAQCKQRHQMPNDCAP